MTTLKDIEDTQEKLRNGETGQAVNEAFIRLVDGDNGYTRVESYHEDIRIWFDDGDDESPRPTLPYPTTNTDDAVVEVPEGLLLVVVQSETVYGANLRADHDHPYEMFFGEAPTLATAICIAILEHLKGQCDG